ncbi:glycosyltransferase family 4 protein [Paenibacillus lignilyticus]|uniref:glycosyltransferase family 4 protein n=1 Tax=Paenibacillus lignilyticus TaxID=1172615 RepID=UPI001F0B0E00|nr:glycosyltransferase [Paenibacillus lignilyticus]
MVNTSDALSNLDGIQLSIAFPKKGLNDIREIQGSKINFYAFSPVKETQANLIIDNKNLEKIIQEVKPDIVHIFGTEYLHSLAMVNICKKLGINSIISIQGLVSVISRHYMALLPLKVQRSFTFRDLIKRDNLKKQQQKIYIRGKYEIEALQKVKHVIGRTTWDKACTLQINSDIKYYHCNETLRSEFYKHSWDINHCERHSIFISQGSYPLKGLHFMIEALPIILKKFPDVKLYIAGPDITKYDTLVDKLKISSYGLYIKKLINKYNLQGHVIFTGLLDEGQMCQRFLKSNVFVSASTIENESNSLSEAKILGLPCIASYVGGVINRINHEVDGFLYQFDAPYMLAHYVNEIFSSDNLCLKFSENARAQALEVHDIKENTATLIEIYKSILKS